MDGTGADGLRELAECFFQRANIQCGVKNVFNTWRPLEYYTVLIITAPTEI